MSTNYRLPQVATPSSVRAYLEEIEADIERHAQRPDSEDPQASRDLLAALDARGTLLERLLPDAMVSAQLLHMEPETSAGLLRELEPLAFLLVTAYSITVYSRERDEDGLLLMLEVVRGVIERRAEEIEMLSRTEALAPIISSAFLALVDAFPSPEQKIHSEYLSPLFRALAGNVREKGRRYAALMAQLFPTEERLAALSACPWFRPLFGPYISACLESSGESEELVRLVADTREYGPGQREELRSLLTTVSLNFAPYRFLYEEMEEGEFRSFLSR